MATIASAAPSVRAPLSSLLWAELAPRPGRLATAARAALCCAVVVTVVMVFRIPMAAYATYVGLVVAREDVVASVFTALVCAIAVTLGVALALLMFAFDAGDPAVRLPIIALATAAGMYASRALKIGPAAFLATYILVSSQTHIDRSMTAEVFVRVMIWLWVATMLPVAVMVVAQIATGARPGAIARRSALGLLAALADGLRNPQIGGLREHHAEAVELVASSHRAAKVNALSKRHVGDDARLVEILLTLLAMQDVLPTETPLALRARLADLCDACASAFERRDAAPPPAEPIAMDPTFGPAPPDVRAVVSALAAALERLRHGLDLKSRGIAEHDPGARRPSLSSKRDRPENIRFALKATLAVMSAYLIYTALDWPGISTAVTTCFFVLLGSLGESMYKSTLRISGALFGGVAAGLCIALVLPAMTDIGQLALLIAMAAGICGWVAAGSELLSYMGLQMAFAFFLGVLQGYGPTTDFTVLSDRVIGILLGNVLVAVIFSSLWPTSTKARAETAIDRALDELAAFAGDGMPRDVGPRLAVLESLDHARRFASFSSFELRMIPGAEPQLGIALHELLRLAGFAFVAAESRGPVPTERLRRDDKRAAELLRSLERVVPSGIPLTPAVADVRTPADRVAEGASLSDQAALEANALFLSELERAHAVTA